MPLGLRQLHLLSLSSRACAPAVRQRKEGGAPVENAMESHWFPGIGTHGLVEFVAVPYAWNPSRQQALLPLQIMSVAPAFVWIHEYHKTGEKASVHVNVARQIHMAA